MDDIAGATDESNSRRAAMAAVVAADLAAHAAVLMGARIERIATAALASILVGKTIGKEQAAEEAEGYALELVKRLDASSAARARAKDRV